jgi:hypothetical protein
MNLKPEVIHVLERDKLMCESALARLKEKAAHWEQQFGVSTDSFVKRFNSGETGDDLDFFRWYALAQAIKDWQATYDGLQELLANSEMVSA